MNRGSFQLPGRLGGENDFPAVEGWRRGHFCHRVICSGRDQCRAIEGFACFQVFHAEKTGGNGSGAGGDKTDPRNSRHFRKEFRLIPPGSDGQDFQCRRVFKEPPGHGFNDPGFQREKGQHRSQHRGQRERITGGRPVIRDLFPPGDKKGGADGGNHDATAATGALRWLNIVAWPCSARSKESPARGALRQAGASGLWLASIMQAP